MTAPPSRLASPSNVVLFDGVCVLCDRSMRWLLARDRNRALCFAPLQGETARGVFARHPSREPALASVLYVRGLGTPMEQVLDRSDAALAILWDIGGPWRGVSWLRLLPRALRDAVYDFVAKRRYRWFGKLEACALPAPEQSDRFLP